MADRVARALNFLDADRALLDANNLLDFIKEYFINDIDEPNGNRPLPLITVMIEYHNTYHMHNTHKNNNKKKQKAKTVQCGKMQPQ